jgi:TPR repeat protein
MILREKKISLRKKLCLLTTVSTFSLSTMVGYCTDERLAPPGYVAPQLEDLSPKQYAAIKAVKDGDLSTVKRLVNIEGVDKDTCDLEDRNSLLHLAIQAQKRSIFDFFLKVNCNVNIKNAYGETPLHEVASTGDKDMLDRLLEEDTACVNTQDKDGNTAFHLAIVRKHIDCVSSFMSAKGFDYTLRNKKGFTVVDLLDQQIQGARGQAAHAQELKTALLRDFNVTVQGILQKQAPITPSIQRLAASVIQQNRKFFLSYCWNRMHSTKPMVDDFENLLKKLEITNYYRDVREEEGLGMTLGTHIEDFMKNASDADVTVIFLNDAYLRSRNCMYEFLQVWDAKTQKISSRAFIIRHPDFRGIFGGPNAAVPYIEHWGEAYKKLAGKNVAAADRQEFLTEMTLVTDMEKSMASIISELSAHIQADYAQQRSKGFEDIFKLALTEEYHSQSAASDMPQLRIPSAQTKKGEGEEKKSFSELKKRGAESKQELEQEAAEDERIEGADKQRVRDRQKAEIKKKDDESKQELEQESAVARAAEAEQYYNRAQKYHYQGMRQDYERAREWYEKAAALGNTDAQNTLGNLCYNGQGGPKDYEKAREWWEQSAAQGNAFAQGALYNYGLGRQQDYVQAREWYEKAAAQGNALAQNNLGNLCNAGHGAPQDYAQAREWYEKAAAQGNPAAQINLGSLYYNGLGVLQDYVQAREWWEKSVAQGHPLAQCMFGTLYYDGLGAPQDYVQAREWFEKAAAQDDALAQYFLGLLYYDGQGVQKDYIQAREWFEKAAAQGNALAQYNLGLLYYEGQGVQKDYIQAREWFEKAAEQGNAEAQYFLGMLYYYGQGVAQDYVQAKEWLEKSAIQNDVMAQYNLGLLYYKGLGVQKDYIQARAWYEKSAAQGNADAQDLLGNIYSYGQGIPQDCLRAREWYEKAAAQGNEHAQLCLKVWPSIEKCLERIPSSMKIFRILKDPNLTYATLHPHLRDLKEVVKNMDKGLLRDNEKHLAIIIQASNKHVNDKNKRVKRGFMDSIPFLLMDLEEDIGNDMKHYSKHAHQAHPLEREFNNLI